MAESYGYGEEATRHPPSRAADPAAAEARRLEQFYERFATYLVEAQSQCRQPLSPPVSNDGAPSGHWDAESAEALARVHERSAALPRYDDDKHLRPEEKQTEDHPHPPAITTSTGDELSRLSLRLEQAISTSLSGNAVAALGARLANFERRLDTALATLATRSDVGGLALIEAHVLELSQHIGAAHERLSRLEHIEAELAQLSEQVADAGMRAADGHSLLTQPVVAELAESLAEQLAQRVSPPGADALADIRRLIEIHLAAQRREEDRRVGALDGIRQEVMGLTARLAAVEGEIGMAVGMDEAYQEPQPAEHHALRWPEPEPLARVYHRSSRLPPSRPHQSAPLDDAPAASGSTPAVGFPPAGELPHRQSKAGPPREETIGAPRRTNSGAPARSRPAPASPARQAPSGFFSGALLAAIAVLVALGAGLTAYGVLLTGSMNTPAGNGSAPSKGAAVGIGKAAAVGTSADHVMAAELWFPPRASEAPADQAQAPVSLSTAGRPAAKASGLQLASWAPRTASSSASGSDTIAAAPTLPPAAIGPLSLRLAASWGNPSAEFAVARRFAQSGPRRDMAQAVLWYRRSAMHGFAAAQYRLAGLYERGVGVPADLAQSRAWYRSAAEQGNVKAMHNAGVFAARGRGGAIDYAEAARWFREAAEHGVHDSQFNVAIFYESGLGVDQDPVQAFKWFSLAARYDDSEAERRRDRLTILLSPGQLAEGRSLVTAWSRKPAKAAANDARIAAEVWKASRLETG